MAVFILHQFCGLPGEEYLAALLAVQYLAIPATRIQKGEKEVLEKCVLVAARAQQTRIVAQYVGTVKAGDFGKDTVNTANRARWISHKEADCGPACVDECALDRNGAGLHSRLKKPCNLFAATFVGYLHGQHIELARLAEFDTTLFDATQPLTLCEFGHDFAKFDEAGRPQQSLNRFADDLV